MRTLGGWKFEFVQEKWATFDVTGYQNHLNKIRAEYEPFAPYLDPTKAGKIDWKSPLKNPEEATTSNTLGVTAPVYEDNTFAVFSYDCTKNHTNFGDDHGIWTLLWDPTLGAKSNNLNARCAPRLFKHVSNLIQEDLVNEFPRHFKLEWEHGVCGYQGFKRGPEALNAAIETYSLAPTEFAIFKMRLRLAAPTDEVIVEESIYDDEDDPFTRMVMCRHGRPFGRGCLVENCDYVRPTFYYGN